MNIKILPGFDYGNSPSQIENIDFSKKQFYIQQVLEHKELLMQRMLMKF